VVLKQGGANRAEALSVLLKQVQGVFGTERVHGAVRGTETAHGAVRGTETGTWCCLWY